MVNNNKYKYMEFCNGFDTIQDMSTREQEKNSNGHDVSGYA